MLVGIDRASRSVIAIGLVLCASPALAQTAWRPAPPVAPAVRLAAPWRLAPPDAARPAQPQPVSPTGRGNWQVEIGAGVVLATTASAGGAGTLPPPGANIAVVGGRTSRRVSSWAFGDGSVLLNDAIAATPGAPAARVAPLDSVLTTSGFGGRPVVVGQLRVVRAVSPRFSIEAGFDAGQISLAPSQQTRDQVEATRASYVSAFQALFSDAAHFSSPTATTTVDYGFGGGYRAVLTGAVRIHFGAPQRLRAYVVAGAGGAFMFGDGTGLALTGNYTFSAPLFGTRVWNTLVVRAHPAPARPVGVFGGGVTREFSRGRGIIVDARVHVSPSAFDTRLETFPKRDTTTFALISTSTSPSIQFSSTPSISSSLQTNLQGFISHSGSMVATTTLSVLYFIRY
jgi:hypothetical protein